MSDRPEPHSPRKSGSTARPPRPPGEPIPALSRASLEAAGEPQRSRSLSRFSDRWRWLAEILELLAFWR